MGKSRKSSSNRVSKAKDRNEKVLSLVNQILKVATGPSTNDLERDFARYETLYDLISRINTLLNEHQFPSLDQISDEEAISNFTQWASNNNIRSDKLMIDKAGDFGLGIFANDNIELNDEIMRIPKRLMITSEAAQNECGSFSEDDPVLSRMPSVCLALYLLRLAIDKNSFWKPYIDILPKTHNTVLYFTKEDMLLLKGTSVFLSAVNLYRSLVRQFAYLYKLIASSTDANAMPLRSRFTFEGFSCDSFRWAVSTVMTRQNPIPSSDDPDSMVLALMPFYDMFNHCTGTFSTDFDDDLGSTLVYSMRPYNKHEQVFIYYGSRSNSDFFLHNGFVYSENLNSTISIRLGVGRNDKLNGLKNKILERISLFGQTNFDVRASDPPISSELIAMTRVVCACQEILEFWISLNDDALLSSQLRKYTYPDKCLTEEAEITAWRFLETRLRLLLQAYPTTIAEDEGIVQKANTKNPEKSPIACDLLAIQFRLCEKKLLEQAMGYCAFQAENVQLPYKSLAELHTVHVPVAQSNNTPAEPTVCLVQSCRSECADFTREQSPPVVAFTDF